MTTEEAIKDIIESGIELGAGDYVDIESLKIAVRALAKQIPKEPYVSRYTMFYLKGIPIVQEYYLCPNCRYNMSKFYITSEIIFCPKCGQAIKQEDL